MLWGERWDDLRPKATALPKSISRRFRSFEKGNLLWNTLDNITKGEATESVSCALSSSSCKFLEFRPPSYDPKVSAEFLMTKVYQGIKSRPGSGEGHFENGRKTFERIRKCKPTTLIVWTEKLLRYVCISSFNISFPPLFLPLPYTSVLNLERHIALLFRTQSIHSGSSSPLRIEERKSDGHSWYDTPVGPPLTSHLGFITSCYYL